MKLELKKFDPSCIKSDSVIVFIGKRNTGKSYCMKDILSYHKDLPVGIVISPTEVANNYFEKFIPNMLIYDEYEPAIIKRFVERQININKQKNDQVKKFGTSEIDNRAFLILDDCLYDKTWPTDKNIRSIFMNGRHYKIFFLITMQFCLGLPPILRANILLKNVRSYLTIMQVFLMTLIPSVLLWINAQKIMNVLLLIIKSKVINLKIKLNGIRQKMLILSYVILSYGTYVH
jgi:hypothetical protein